MTGSTPRRTLGAPLSISKEAPALRVVWSMATGLMRTVREPTRKSKERASRRCATSIACEATVVPLMCSKRVSYTSRSTCVAARR